MKIENTEKLKSLQEQKRKILEKLNELDDIFKEEKDNEESWPGHSSTRYQSANVESLVLMDQLASIEKEIKELSQPQ